jgi:hypothetical protein
MIVITLYFINDGYWTRWNDSVFYTSDRTKFNQMFVQLNCKTTIDYLFRVMVFNATFNNISGLWWRSVLLVEETAENHRHVASHWQTLSHNAVSSTPDYKLYVLWHIWSISWIIALPSKADFNLFMDSRKKKEKVGSLLGVRFENPHSNQIVPMETKLQNAHYIIQLGIHKNTSHCFGNTDPAVNRMERSDWSRHDTLRSIEISKNKLGIFGCIYLNLRYWQQICGLYYH